MQDANHRTAAAEQRAATLSDQLAAQRRATAAAAASPGHTQTTPSASAVALVLLPQTRGTDPVPIIAVGADTSTVAIALTIEGAARKTYEAALKDPATNRIIWRSQPLTSDGTALVTVALPARLLKAQHYVVDTFGGQGARDFVGTYAVEVVRR